MGLDEEGIWGPGFVYAIRAEGSDLVKIGHSADPRGRMRRLQTGSPLPLVLFWMAHVSSMTRAEDRLHHQFEDRWSHGEWFTLPGIQPRDMDRALSRTGYRSFR